MGHRVGYVRVSSVEQNTARQLDGVELDRVFTDRASGATVDRPELTAALVYCRVGDTLVVHSMDRLARNLGDLLKIVGDLTQRGISVEFQKETQTFSPSGASPMAELMLSMLGAVAQFERSMLRERQREGIALAKKRGVYKGRKPALSATQKQEIRTKDNAASGKGRAALAAAYGVSRPTLYACLKSI